MAINPIPVTFHVSVDPRPELIEARRRRVRPYKTIAQTVAAFVVMGVGLGYISSRMVHIPKTTTVATPVRAPVAAAPPSFHVWSPPAAVAPARQQTAAAEPAPYDPTPVGTIPDNMTANRPAPSAETGPALSSAIAPAAGAVRVFAPMERAPDYSGFKVIAGH
jgi:hypothetical protein